MFRHVFDADYFLPILIVTFILTIIGSFILYLLKIFFRRITWLLTLRLSFFFTISLGVFIFSYEFMSRPMMVTKHKLQGKYVINRKLFKGKNADWQYTHYWLEIKQDAMYLHVMDKGKEIAQYKKEIHYCRVKKHTFFFFDINTENTNDDNITDEDRLRAPIELEYEKTEKVYTASTHHMLSFRPRLNAYPLYFNVVLHSSKYGNMFFRKGRWRNRKFKKLKDN